MRGQRSEALTTARCRGRGGGAVVATAETGFVDGGGKTGGRDGEKEETKRRRRGNKERERKREGGKLSRE